MMLSILAILKPLIGGTTFFKYATILFKLWPFIQDLIKKGQEFALERTVENNQEALKIVFAERKVDETIEETKLARDRINDLFK